MKMQYYFLSIDKGMSTYAILLGILSSVLAGLITNVNTHWSVMFIISILFLIIGIIIVAKLHYACNKYYERYSKIPANTPEDKRRETALKNTATDDFHCKYKENIAELFEKKFNTRSCIAMVLSFASIILIVCNNIYQNYNDPTASSVIECSCCSNNNQEQNPESTTFLDTLSNCVKTSNSQPDTCEGESSCEEEDNVEIKNSQVRPIQKMDEMPQDSKNKTTVDTNNGCQNKNVEKDEQITSVPHQE